MTRNEILRRFPNAAESFIKANLGAESEVSNAKPQCHHAPPLGATVQGETKSVERITVRFVGHRCKLLDPDNFAASVKNLLDGLRLASLIKDDSPEHIILETSQVKVKHRADEYTEITIEPIYNYEHKYSKTIDKPKAVWHI